MGANIIFPTESISLSNGLLDVFIRDWYQISVTTLPPKNGGGEAVRDWLADRQRHSVHFLHLLGAPPFDALESVHYLHSVIDIYATNFSQIDCPYDEARSINFASDERLRAYWHDLLHLISAAFQTLLDAAKSDEDLVNGKSTWEARIKAGRETRMKADLAQKTSDGA